jgi:hypothetical protein
VTAPVSIVETVTARGVVWRIRCGGCYVDVGGRLIDIGTRTVTTETVDALIAALRIAADIAEPATPISAGVPGRDTPARSADRGPGVAELPASARSPRVAGRLIAIPNVGPNSEETGYAR